MNKAPAGLQQLTVVGAVALVHAAGLWALLDHALQPAASATSAPVTMVMLLNEPAAVAAPPAAPPPPQAQPTPRAAPPAAPKRQPKAPPPLPTVVPAQTAPDVPVPTELPMPSSETAPAPAQAVAAPTPTPSAAEGSAPAPLQVAKAAAAASGVTRRIEDVDYLRAPVLEYPSASRRFGEQGRVVLRVLIGADGQAEKIELAEPSAFRRLNEAAIEAARRALYKPHTEDGVPQPAWALVALSFQLRR